MDPLEKRIAQYEKVLAHNVWNKTPLLKIFGDRLRDMLKRLKVGKDSHQGYPESVSVFVLLYHEQGGQLTIWEDMIKKIQYAVGRRPVYLTLDEAKSSIRDVNREAIVVMDIPKQSILTLDGLMYLKVEDVKLLSVKGVYWGKKLFYFNNYSLVEMNSELTD